MRFTLIVLTSFFSWASAVSAQNFRVVGTEPFWGMTVSPRGITFEALGLAKRSFSYVAPRPAAGKPADVVRVYQLGRANTLILQKVDKCSDGMSDMDYPYTALFVDGNRVWSGCAIKLSTDSKP